MKAGRIAALAACAMALAAAFAAAQEAPNAPTGGEADPFDAAAFDLEAGRTAATAPGAESAPLAPAAGAAETSYLVGGAVSISTRAYLPPDLGGYAAASSASGKVFAKVAVPDYGSLYASYSLTQAFFAGLAGDGPAMGAPPVDLSSPAFALSELHYSFDIGKKLFFRLGKQLLSWGPSRIWSPVDFVNAERADFFAPLDLREGKSGLRVHLPMGSYNAFLFADFSGSVSGGKVLDPLDSTVLSGRFDATLGGFELGLSGRLAASEQGVAGFDFSGDLLGFAAYGELAAYPAYGSYDGALEASLGLSRSLGERKKWKVAAEAYYDSRGADLTGDAAAMASATALYMGRYYAYASIEGEDFPAADLSTGLAALANLSDSSYTIRFTEGASLRGVPPFSLIVAYYGGGKAKEFTAPFGDGAWSATLQTRIEF